MAKEINVTIERKENIELIFNFESKLKLNLSSDNTQDTQSFFLGLLNEIVRLNDSITFTLEDEKDDLFHDVANKYLNNLENEIKKVVNEIPQRLLGETSK